MTSEPTQTSNGRGRVVMVPVVAIVALTVMALAARPGLAGLGATLGARTHLAAATSTPTRTPRPATATTKPIPVELSILALAATGTPVAPPVAPQVTPSPLTPYLADIVQRYGMDASRRFVVVDPDLQRMTIWDPGRLVLELPVSTGDERRGYVTQPWYGLVGAYWGTFHAFGSFADEGWFLYDTPSGSILIHSAPYTVTNGVKIYEDMDALGSYPASRGCIRLRPEDARWFTEWKPQGAPIVILPHKNP
jgi:lipoprotein-anchoring transpeptidase ErfK/SrfK